MTLGSPRLSCNTCEFLPCTALHDVSVAPVGHFSVTAGGGTHQRLSTEQRYFHDLAAMSRRRLCVSCFHDWTGAAPIRSIQGLIDHVGVGKIITTESPLQQLRVTMQLSQSVATAWSDDVILDCAIAYNMVLHQRDQALRGVSTLLSQDERESLRTAPFGSSSLFDDLPSKLQLREKVVSRQRDKALYRGSAPFAVARSSRPAPHSRTAPTRTMLRHQAPMLPSSAYPQPFQAARGRGSGRPFRGRGGRRHKS